MKPHLCHVFSTFGNGGPEVRTCKLIDNTLDEFRHTVVSISGDLSAKARVLALNEVTFLSAPAKQRFYPIALRHFLRGLQPDLVLTYGWGGVDALLAARLAGYSRVIHAEDGFLPDEAKQQKLRRLFTRRLLLRLASCVVCPSQNLVRIARHTWWLRDNKIRFIANGIEELRFSPASPEQRQAARNQLGIEPDALVLGTVGQLRHEKNHERLIRAFAGVPQARNLHLYLVGEGALRPRLEQVISELRLQGQVHLLGMTADPAPFYQAIDLFALSSDTEQMPLSVLEAMASGLPVVSTDVGDVGTILAKENQALVTPLGDEKSYRGALVRMIEEPQLRKQLGQANRAKCLQEFTMSVMVQRYRDLYAEILGSQRSTLRFK